jgi:hypothetical protein
MYIATHPAEVSAIEAKAAQVAGSSALSVGGRLLLGTAGSYGAAMLFPSSVGQSDTNEMADKERLQQEKEQNQEKEAQPEPQAAGGGKKEGGGKKPVDPNAGKKADDLISGSLKRSQSYHTGMGGLTKQQILDKASKGDQKAQQMKKLIEQGDRLKKKVKNKKKQ